MIPRKPRWTNRELGILKQNYETGVELQVIADLLNRSKAAIRTRAQIMEFRRPRRINRSQVLALKDQAGVCGLRADTLPDNPSALRVLIFLAEKSVASQPQIVESCGIKEPTIASSLRILRSSGLVYVDSFVSPRQFSLTHRAFDNRLDLPIPYRGDNSKLPTADELTDLLDRWLPKVCTDLASAENYQEFLLRQLQYVQHDDITMEDFYSLIVGN